MKLERLIKMPDIKDAHLKALLEIIFTSSWLDNKQNKFFASYGLSPQQYNILRILRGSHPKSLTTQDIKTRMVDKSPHTTRMIDKLESSELVKRERSESDRRVINVNITKKGLDLVNDIDLVLPQHIQLMHTLSIEDAQMLSNLLEKLRNDSE
jgi:MarR family transcriptional regulator, 2-MHQ and catechol-resistance regulon repressor